MPRTSIKNQRGSAKKRRQKERGQRKVKAEAGLDEVLIQADRALERSDLDAALGLFARAAELIRGRMDGSVASPAVVGVPDLGEDEVRTILSRTLGKLGEVKVGIGDPEGARDSFVEAIEILGPGGGTGGDQQTDDLVGADLSMASAQRLEARAGIHLYLGQLSSEREALNSYRAGIKDLEQYVVVMGKIAAQCVNDAAMEGGDGDDEDDGVTTGAALSEAKRQLSCAHCSVAELYMTDLCFEPDAEEQCEASLAAALAVDDGVVPDALQTKANLRLSQRRGDEAVRSILDAYERMRVGCEAMADLVGLGKEKENGAGKEKVEETDGGEEKCKAKELLEVEAVNSLPGFEFRTQTAKILLECAAVLGDSDRGGDCEIDNGGSGKDENDARKNMCVEFAIQVLGSLLAENDEVIELFFLLGCAFEALSPPDVGTASHYWQAALTMLTKVKKGIEEEGGDEDVDNDGLEGVIDQMNEIKERLEAMLEEAEEAGGI